MGIDRCSRILATGVLTCSSLAALPEPARAQRPPRDDDTEILVTGERRSAASNIAPVATFDSDAILATGATTIPELLRAIRGVVQSADGSDPIYLLNAQRVSGYQEISALPTEAIEKLEVLPETAALKFGFPPTRRVLNFITKRRFRQIEVRASAGTATRGGTATEQANLALTRLRGDARLTMGLEYRHTDPLYASDRGVLPDPDLSFDAIGNVRGQNGEIDPALSAAAGRTVQVASVPDAASDRSSLSAYLPGAGTKRLFDTGPYRTVFAQNDAIKAEAVLADRIGATLAGSISLSAEHSRDRTLGGPAYATFLVPASNPYSPFSRPVLLDRYLTEAEPLRRRQSTTTLHGGFMLRGALGGWRWDVTGAVDQQRSDSSSENNIDSAAANAAVAAGTNPFAPLDPGLLDKRLTNYGQLRTRSSGAKAVATHTPVRLPAGGVAVTVSAEVDRSTADSASQGPNPSELHLARSRVEGSLALDVPLASHRENFLSFAGDLSANASVRLRSVSGFGSLNDASYGLSWSPLEGVQLLANARRSAAAPDMKAQSTPVLRVRDVPIFDAVQGRTYLATVIQGGNPDLLAERRQVRSMSLNIRPFPKRQLRLGASYEATTIRDQTGTIYAMTARTESLLPELFVRDATGRLVSVAYRPVNFAVERQRTLNVTLSASGPLRKVPASPRPGSSPTGNGRGSFYAGLGLDIKFSDRLQLRPGTPELDLLNGDSVNGSSTIRSSGWIYGGVNYQDIGFSFDAWLGVASRVRNVDPSGDLYFPAIPNVNLTGYFSVRRIVKAPWARRLRLQLEVRNATDSYQHIRYADGRVPIRYQNQSVGRTATVTLRKLF